MKVSGVGIEVFRGAATYYAGAILNYLGKAISTAIAVSAICSYFCNPATASSINIPSPIQIIDAPRLLKHGYRGQGVRVGVISNGANNYAALSKSGILPKDIKFYGSTPGYGDEGDWMMQVIHDIAPAAKLGFCSPEESSAIGSAGIVECAEVLADKFHANIITDDLNAKPIFWSPSPKTIGYKNVMKSDNSVIFISGVGNFGGGYYQHTWMPMPFSLADKSYAAQDFGRSVGQGRRPYDSFIMPPHTGVNIFLGVNTNPESLPKKCPSSNAKMTLALLNGSNDVLASKTQRCSLLRLTYVNDKPSAIIARIVVLEDGTQPSGRPLAIKMLAQWTGRSATRSVPLRYNTLGGASNSGLLGPMSLVVAAVDPDTDLWGHPAIEPFAGSGPLRIDYGINRSGSRMIHLSSPLLVQVPDIVVPDRFMVAMPTTTGAGYVMRPFIGDSAAGPAAAGVAALLLSANVSVDRISELVEKSAHPPAHSNGWNPRYGYGVVDADKAAVMAGVLHGGQNPFATQVENTAASTIHRFQPSPAFLHKQMLTMAAVHGSTQSLAEIQKSADEGDEGGQFWLAVYDQKIGRNADAAQLCWRDAQQSGFPPAENCLGTLFYRGLGVPEDYRAAYIWWLRAAQAGMANAAFRIGLLKSHGFGTATNLVDAYALMLTAKMEGLRNSIEATSLNQISNRLSAEDLKIATNIARRYVSDPSLIQGTRDAY